MVILRYYLEVIINGFVSPITFSVACHGYVQQLWVFELVLYLIPVLEVFTSFKAFLVESLRPLMYQIKPSVGRDTSFPLCSPFSWTMCKQKEKHHETHVQEEQKRIQNKK